MSDHAIAPSPFINSLVAAGVLSPGARDMDPRAAVEQHAEANVMTYAEKADLFDRANVMFVGTVEALVEADLVDLEPLLLAYGARDESFDADLITTLDELATVEAVATNPDGSMTIYTDQMNLAVPAGAEVEYRPSMASRCCECGESSTGGDGSDGLCGNCADVAEGGLADG